MEFLKINLFDMKIAVDLFLVQFASNGLFERTPLRFIDTIDNEFSPFLLSDFSISLDCLYKKWMIYYWWRREKKINSQCFEISQQNTSVPIYECFIHFYVLRARCEILNVLLGLSFCIDGSLRWVSRSIKATHTFRRCRLAFEARNDDIDLMR